MKEHKFIMAKSDQKYGDIIFCEKCGYVSWTATKTAEYNKRELQPKIPKECIGEDDNNLTPPHL